MKRKNGKAFNVLFPLVVFCFKTQCDHKIVELLDVKNAYEQITQETIIKNINKSQKKIVPKEDKFCSLSIDYQ